MNIGLHVGGKPPTHMTPAQPRTVVMLEDDKVLVDIGHLKEKLKENDATPAISLFMLPSNTPLRGGAEWEVNGGGYTAWQQTEPTYCLGPNGTGNRENQKEHMVGVQYWVLAEAYTTPMFADGMLRALATILLPDNPSPNPQQVAHELLKVATPPRKTRWAGLLRLRGAWNNGEQAKRWVEDNQMFDFTYCDRRGPARFCIDRWNDAQKFKHSITRRLFQEKNYWWVDIPEVLKLVEELIPTIKKRREKRLRGELWHEIRAKISDDLAKGVIPMSDGVATSTRSWLAKRYDVDVSVITKAIESSEQLKSIFTSCKQSVAGPTTGGVSLESWMGDRADPRRSLEEQRGDYTDWLEKQGWSPTKAEEHARSFTSDAELQEDWNELVANAPRPTRRKSRKPKK